MAANVTLVTRLGQLREDQDIQQKDVAAVLGVHRSAVCRWEAGIRIPSICYAAAWAPLVSRRLVATTLDGRVVAEGQALAALAGLREAAGVSRSELARLLQLPYSTIASWERKAGPHTCLITVQRHLGGLGYRVGLAPTQAGVAA